MDCKCLILVLWKHIIWLKSLNFIGLKIFLAYAIDLVYILGISIFANWFSRTVIVSKK